MEAQCGKRLPPCVLACVRAFSAVILPRIVMVLLELRLVSQSSSHEGINANTWKWERAARSWKIRQETLSGGAKQRARPVTGPAGGACALEASRSGRREAVEGWRCGGAALCSCGGFSPDICALTSTGGFHCFCGRGEGRGGQRRGLSRRPRLDRSSLRPSHFLLLTTPHTRACAGAVKFLLVYFFNMCAAIKRNVGFWSIQDKWTHSDVRGTGSSLSVPLRPKPAEMCH